MGLVKSFAARFAEPSSWAGLGGLLAVVGLNVPAGALNSATLIGAGIAGLLAFFLPESK